MAVARGETTRRLTLVPRISTAQAVVAITVLAALLRFLWIDSKGYWQDEALTLLHNRESFGGMLDAVLNTETTPPLYFVLAWLWDKPFSSGEAGLRALSALLGTAAVPAAYLA